MPLEAVDVPSLARVPRSDDLCTGAWIQVDGGLTRAGEVLGGKSVLHAWVRGYLSQPQVGGEDAGGVAAPAHLQAVSIKAVNERYAAFETVQPHPGQMHAIPVGQCVKSSIFDPRRCTAQDTGLASFNAIAKATTTNPHHFTRYCLNLWSTVKRLNGGMDNVWIAELCRVGQARCSENLTCATAS